MGKAPPPRAMREIADKRRRLLLGMLAAGVPLEHAAKRIGVRPSTAEKILKLSEGEVMPENTEKDYREWMAALNSTPSEAVETPADYADLVHEMTSGEAVRREDAERARLLRNEIRIHDYNAERWREELLRRRGGRL